MSIWIHYQENLPYASSNSRVLIKHFAWNKRGMCNCPEGLSNYILLVCLTEMLTSCAVNLRFQQRENPYNPSERTALTRCSSKLSASDLSWIWNWTYHHSILKFHPYSMYFLHLMPHLHTYTLEHSLWINNKNTLYRFLHIITHLT